MAIQTEIYYAGLDTLFLDPMNPRLGRINTGRHVPQDKILELMRDWTLEELAVSFLESGYWPQEALICVREELYGRDDSLVVERRAAKLLPQNCEIQRLSSVDYINIVVDRSQSARR